MENNNGENWWSCAWGFKGKYKVDICRKRSYSQKNNNKSSRLKSHVSNCAATLVFTASAVLTQNTLLKMLPSQSCGATLLTPVPNSP